MPTRTRKPKSYRSALPDLSTPNAAQQALTQLAATLPLSEAQRRDVERHDLPKLSFPPAAGLWVVTMGGTNLFLHSDQAGVKMVNYYVQTAADYGSRFFVLTQATLREVAPAEAGAFVPGLPPFYAVVERIGPRLIRVEPHTVQTSPEGYAIWPDDAMYEEAQALLRETPSPARGHVAQAHHQQDVAAFYQRARRKFALA